MQEVLRDSTVIDRFLIREHIERYLIALDEQNWDGIAACFTEDSVSHYNDEPQDLVGGKGVADFLHRMQAYNVTTHVLCRIATEVEGDTATARFKTVAILHQGEHGKGRVQYRSVSFVDTLVKHDGQWLITSRLHSPDFQFDALSSPMVLY